jgi:hypothetical protein
MAEPDDDPPDEEDAAAAPPHPARRPASPTVSARAVGLRLRLQFRDGIAPFLFCRQPLSQDAGGAR